MKGKKGELARASWRQALKHYIFAEKQTGIDFSALRDFITLVQNNNLDEVLYASTSHEMLIVSTEHRYDAKVDKIRISFEEGRLEIEYFSAKNNEIGHEIVAEVNNHGVDKTLEYVKRLLG